MKIYDITKLASQNTIKPELNSVYVTHTEKGITYVVTDTFRLIEIKLEDETAKEFIPAGFYSLFVWKNVCKAKSILDLKASAQPREDMKECVYPDYTKIIPSEVETNDYQLKQFDVHLVSSSIQLIEKITGKANHKLIEKYQQSKNENHGAKMFYLNDWSKDGHSEITLLIMPLQKN